MNHPPVLVDARGLRCPWPVLRLARAMREAPSAAILADDPQAPAEIAALADASGWEIVRRDEMLIVSRMDR